MDTRYLTVAGACLTQFTVIGVLFSFGLFFRELQGAFGWSRTLLSGFPGVGGPEALFVFVLIYGFGHGGFFTVVSPTIAEYFGVGALGAAFGTVLFFATIGGAVGPILAGLSYDLWGSYMPAFATLLGLALLGLGLVLTLPRRG